MSIDEIQKLKKRIDEDRANLKKRFEPLENRIKELEEDLTNKISDFNEKLFQILPNYVDEIKDCVEDFDSFKYDGVNIRRDKIIIYAIRDTECFEIYCEEGSFICNKNIENSEISEDMKYILQRINSIFDNNYL